MTRRLLVALGALALVAVVVIGLLQARDSDDARDAPQAKVLDPAAARRALAGSPPELAALHRQANTLLPGGERAFQARLESLKGRPVVVNAWASWCGPCRFELPVFQAQSVRMGRQVAFIGLNVQDATSDARSLQREFPMSYPSYTDGDRRISTGLKVGGLPYTVFYDRTGRRTLVHQGPYATEAQLARDTRRYALGA